jgi:phage shock protein A
VRRGLADVTTSRRRIELQLGQLQQSAAKLQGQAQQALAAGREDLAREALTRRAAVTSQTGDLQAQQTPLRPSRTGSPSPRSGCRPRWRRVPRTQPQVLARC